MSKEDVERGEVYNQEAFEQKMLFSGMKYERNITPSDWDFFIDFGGDLFFYGEGKRKPNDLTIGQRCSIEHVCNSHKKAGNASIGFLFQHNINPPHPVFVKDQPVIKYFWEGQWKTIAEDKTPTVSEFIDKMRKWLKL